MVSTYSNTTIAATRYLLKDNLGSLDTITDEMGAIVRKTRFDISGADCVTLQPSGETSEHK